MIKKLNELKSGESGTLASYGSGGDLELKRHLLGMGFIKGADVELKVIALKLEQFEKTLVPAVVTLLGIVTAVKALQLANALPLIVFNPLASESDFNPLQ